MSAVASRSPTVLQARWASYVKSRGTTVIVRPCRGDLRPRYDVYTPVTAGITRAIENGVPLPPGRERRGANGTATHKYSESDRTTQVGGVGQFIVVGSG